MANKKQKLVLIDAHALIHRAYHALPPLTAPDGRPTGALYGLMSFVLKMLRQLEPDHVAACFDRPETTFREEEYNEYKGTREKADDELVEQLQRGRELFRELGIRVYEEPGFEADDLIATVCERFADRNDMQVIIVSGDLDTLQLVREDHTIVYVPQRGISEATIYDPKAVVDRFGVAPEQMTDFKGLKGDPSDNVPGVAGIGDKGAAKILQRYGTIEQALEQLTEEDVEEMKGRERTMYRKLLDSKEEALFSKHLTTMRRDAPIEIKLEDLRVPDLDRDEVRDVFRALGFQSLLPRLKTEYVPKSRPVQKALFASEDVPEKAAGAKDEERAPKGTLFLIGSCVGNALTELEVISEEGSRAVLPVDIGTLKKELEDSKLIKVGTELKRVIATARTAGIDVAGSLHDIEVVAWLISSEQKKFDLAHLRKKYSCADIYAWQQKKLAETDLEDIYRELEEPLLGILADMEDWGVRIDMEHLRELAQRAEKDVDRIEREIYKVAGEKFNINSPKQISELLFEKLAISTDGVKKTPGGALSTNAETLEHIKDKHAIVPLLLQYREIFKLKSTYIDALPEHVDLKTGRLHTTFRQTGTVTGRLSSESPNVQNIPHGGDEYSQDIRAAFVAEKGWVFASFDYSQVELRIAATLSGDETMMSAFREGKDVHTVTAAEVNDVDPEDVTREMRRMAKVLNFGILYGMGSNAFAKTSGLSRKEAKKFIDRYFANFPGIVKYQQEIIEEGRSKGYVENPLGRRRLLPDLRSSHPRYRAAAERMAINFPIQSLDADIMKKAMIALAEHFKKQGQWGEDVRMLLQIHDQLLFEIRSDILEEAAKAIDRIMTSIYTLEVPLIVDAKTGLNWRDLKPFDQS